MNRRSFLKIAGAAGLLTVTPISIASALAKKVPIIYSDGIHDDTEGLKAAVSGKDFVCDSGIVHVSGDTAIIRGGNFLLSDTVNITDTRAFISNCRFVMSEAARKDGRFMFFMSSWKEMVLLNCHFVGAGIKMPPSSPDAYINLTFP